MQVLLGLDLGTSAAKCLVMTLTGEVLTVASRAYPTHTPRSGWVEQHPSNWWQASIEVVQDSLRSIPQPVSVEGISLSGHMSALCIVDEHGCSVMPSITLADTRSKSQTSYLTKAYRDTLVQRSGNQPIDALLLPKLLWVKENRPELLAASNHVLFPKDYLLYHLTGRFATEPTDAGNSMVYDVHSQAWDRALIEELGVPFALFPEVIGTTDIAGHLQPEAASALHLKPGIPVVTGGADMACSALGTGAVLPGVVSVTIGTAAQVLSAIPTIHPDGVGKITFHRHAVPNSFYALGSIFTGGLAMNWLSSVLNDRTAGSYSPDDIVELGNLAAQMSAEESRLWFLPFMVGRGSPDYSADARACFIGLSANSDRGALARAVMEGVAFNVRECLDVFAGIGSPATRIHIGGGGTKLPIWRSILAGVVGQDVHLMETSDASAIGSAILAGVGIGAFDDVVTAAQSIVQAGEAIKPSATDIATYEKKYGTYRKLISSLEPLFHEIAND